MWFQLAVKRYNGTSWVTEAGGINSALLQTKTATGLNVVIPSGAIGGTVGVNGAVTIGSAVSSVTVQNAFSATYDNYKIIVSGGSAASGGSITLRLGATATGYYGALSFTTYTTAAVAGATDNNAGVFTYFGNANTNNITGNMEINSPFLTKNTVVASSWVGTTTGSSSGHYAGFLNNTLSYTDFTISATGGAWTGGNIRIYGYNNG